MTDDIPAGAEPIWQVPFWLECDTGAVPPAIEWVVWMEWFRERMDVRIPAMFRDTLLYGRGILQLPA